MFSIIILIGESASGKSTIEKELVKRGFNKIVSYTTRPIRKDEIDGIDYHYISEEEFLNKLQNGFFAEYTIYNSWYYGIAIPDCKNDSVVVVEPHGFSQLKKIEGLNIISFYIKVDERTRLIRMVERGDNLLEVFRRIFSDQGVFQFVDQEVNYVIDNNSKINIDDVVNEIVRLIGLEV
jgi:guanylate kinase